MEGVPPDTVVIAEFSNVDGISFGKKGKILATRLAIRSWKNSVSIAAPMTVPLLFSIAPSIVVNAIQKVM